MGDGLVASPYLTNGDNRAVKNQPSDTLFMTAAATGGQWIHDRNDVARALEDLSTSQQSSTPSRSSPATQANRTG